MMKHILALAAIMICMTCTVISEEADDSHELPMTRGAKYVTPIAFDQLNDRLKNTPASQPALLYIGAKWCPHCRNFRPKFNILADDIKHEKKQGILPKCYYYEAEEDKDPISKKFKLSGYPAVLLFSRNKYYKYEGPKEVAQITEWLDNLPEVLAEQYPDHMPGFVEDLTDMITELYQSVKANYRRDPTSQIYMLGGLAVVLGSFGICFIYALILALTGSSDDSKKDD